MADYIVLIVGVGMTSRGAESRGAYTATNPSPCTAKYAVILDATLTVTCTVHYAKSKSKSKGPSDESTQHSTTLGMADSQRL